MLITRCVCGVDTGFKQEHKNGIDLAVCPQCGVGHQQVPINEKQYEDFYSIDYHGDYQKTIGSTPYKDRYKHDRKIARIRLGEYNKYFELGQRTLDIGCGNNAFVDEMRERGFSKTYGLEISCEVNRETTYNGQLQSINFPTEHFDVVTMHDVLEHVVDLNAFLRELNRVVRMDGLAIIDFPNYFVKEGRHHWRPIQHLWYFDQQQLIEYLEKFGFYTEEVRQPIPSKFVIYAKKEKDVLSTGHKILLLPGMGDIYWVATKLRSFCENRGIVLPDVYIWDFDNRPRSREFVERIPFVRFGGYYKAPVDDSVIRDSYLRHCKKGIVEGYKQFDYYISANGLLRDGFSMDDDEFSPYETDWYYPMFEPLEERLYAEKFKARHGRYVLCYFSDMGMFKSWVNDANQKIIHGALSSIASSLEAKIVLTGCKWDDKFNKSITQFDTSRSFINLSGKTNIDELFGLMKNAEAVVGWCGGNTILSTRFKVPTVMFWNKYFRNKKFWNFACPPDSLGNWYFPKSTEEFERRSLTALLRRLTR